LPTDKGQEYEYAIIIQLIIKQSSELSI